MPEDALINAFQELDIVNTKFKGENTLLMLCAARGILSMVNALIKLNAHLDCQNKDGNTALMLACRNRHLETARALVEASSLSSFMEIENITHRTAYDIAMLPINREFTNTIVPLMRSKLPPQENDKCNLQ